MPVWAGVYAEPVIKGLFASIASREVRAWALLYVATRDDVRQLT